MTSKRDWEIVPDAAGEDQRLFFDAGEWQLLEAATARIIPTDHHPGAREAGVVRFIDRMLAGTQFVFPAADGKGFLRMEGLEEKAWQERIESRQKFYREGIVELDGIAAEKFGADFVDLGGVRERPDRKGTYVKNRLLPGGDEERDLTDDFWRVSRKFRPMVPYGALIKKSIYDEIGGFNEEMRTGEDACMWLQLWLRGRFAFVNLPLVESAVVEGSVTAHRLPYSSVRKNMACSFKGLARALRMRKPGTGWFALFTAERLVNQHTRYVLNYRRATHATVEAGKASDH